MFRDKFEVNGTLNIVVPLEIVEVKGKRVMLRGCGETLKLRKGDTITVRGVINVSPVKDVPALCLELYDEMW